jgi:Raf kinase inhibitor-like YbhB/YbcL family protein
MPLTISSTAFGNNGGIPVAYTCEGEDLSPPLHFAGVPASAASLALIVEDPDAPDPRAPQTTWVHWILYDLPPDCTGLAQGVAGSALPPGAREGKNDWRRTGYGGPCPPIGRHRYFHKLFALDTRLGDLGRPNKAALTRAMQGHVLATAVLVGTYEKRSARGSP